jgi:hypothetical protein
MVPDGERLKADDGDALMFKPRRSSAVVLDLIRMVVNGAVDLDREAGGGAVEVEDLGAFGTLSAEFEAVELGVLQAPP